MPVKVELRHEGRFDFDFVVDDSRSDHRDQSSWTCGDNCFGCIVLYTCGVKAEGMEIIEKW